MPDSSKLARPLNNKRYFVLVLGVFFVTAILVACGAVYKTTQKSTTKPVAQKTPEQTYLASPTYKNLKPEQQISIALSKVSQLMSVNGYVEAQNQLQQIKKDYPAAESNIDFLVLQFTVSKALNNDAITKETARKILALNKELPPQYQSMKNEINNYANN